MNSRQHKYIALLITGFGRGGAERQLLNLALHLQGRGYSPVIFSTIERNMFVDELNAHNLDFRQGYFQRGRFSLSGFLRLRREIKELNPLVLITFMYVANMIGRAIRFITPSIRLLTSVRNEKVGGRIRDKLFQATNFLDDTTITNSYSVGKRLVKRGVIAKKKLFVIPNGYDFTAINQAGSMSQPKRDGFMWIAVGNFRPQKNYPLLFRAIQQLVNEGYNFSVRIAGNLYDQEWPKTMARDLGILDRIQFLGVVEAIYDEYPKADAFVMTSEWEGLPNSMIEAMSFSLPVVGTAVGGIPDLIENGKNGFLVNSNDLAELSRAMRQMLQMDKFERNEMGVRGRNTVLNKYDMNTIMAKWDKLIEGNT